jgi:hypothetical protein
MGIWRSRYTEIVLIIGGEGCYADWSQLKHPKEGVMPTAVGLIAEEGDYREKFHLNNS